MHSLMTNGKTKGDLSISAVVSKFGSTTLAAAAIRGALTLAVLSATLLIAASPTYAQTVLYSFAGPPDGANPWSSLTSDDAGNFYGTTYDGGANNYGTVFELSPNGGGDYYETVLYSFCSQPSCADGANPAYGSLIFDADGNLYGTTEKGGTSGDGTVFELSPAGGNWTENVLYSFNGGDGLLPTAGVIFDSVGNLYGTTLNGGVGNNWGNVFELTPAEGGGWTENVLLSCYGADFCVDPYAGLTFDAHGNLYGHGL